MAMLIWFTLAKWNHEFKLQPQCYKKINYDNGFHGYWWVTHIQKKRYDQVWFMDYVVWHIEGYYFNSKTMWSEYDQLN